MSPRGAYPPPDPLDGGRESPPPKPPPAVRAYQVYELLAKAHGVGVVVSKA